MDKTFLGFFQVIFKDPFEIEIWIIHKYSHGAGLLKFHTTVRL